MTIKHVVFRFVAAVAAAIAVADAAPAQPSEARTAERAGTGRAHLRELLWTPVQDRRGETLGGVSDVLVHMPSGRILFLAVDPAELFQQPKVVPPGALEGTIPSGGAPLRLDIARDRWIFAPIVDWDGVGVIKNTDDGARAYAFYQQPWREPEPLRPTGATVVASPDEGSTPARYVSLGRLLGSQLLTQTRQHAGYARDFVLDWRNKRVTHALVTPGFAAAGDPAAIWLAVPVALLNPPQRGDALVVNAGLDALRNAPPWPDDPEKRPAAGIVYRYPAPEGRAMAEARSENSAGAHARSEVKQQR